MRCAFAMLASLELWNVEREQRGEPRLRMWIGAHFGPAVLGDIGNERNMAFAVVGDTVNTASRLQALTREMQSDLIASDVLVTAVRGEVFGAEKLLGRLCHGGERQLRGRGENVPVWVIQVGAGAGAPAMVPV